MDYAVEVDHLEVTYWSPSGPVAALAGVSLSVRSGEFVSILGPSGCGKSTLLLAVAGLLQPTRGHVRVDGKPVQGPVREIGMVFQDHLLLDWRTVLDNVLLQIDLRGLSRSAFLPSARALLGRMGLRGFETKYPFELSGGMRQRVAIARAIIHNPRLLLMDEPFGALDALTREQIRVDLERLWMEWRNTVLFVTHDIAEAILLGDRVVIMTSRPGRLADIVPVSLPRPRTADILARPEFLDYRARIQGVLYKMGVLRV
ncbi:MAG: ABC transporter ATP-binding protein [Armatimonadota bacterium]|nr:ABC transporter ATP-binding protein [Armatimonadota bacterium]MDR7471524.1 ABC transporter ATP-binding protein [Armatimonadota bacterium]MDR7507808.1 ABC transporter ATP-binding protein [Armatimonadota bacterium]MDR7509582.1 ABC transporter ATP-binding protein [Armatimonadota bacterium]MDR7516428.1 ABC transporter ATP-binding protein [Armatimonadota bacterium]